MENCLQCNSELEYSGLYARCTKCGCLFVNLNGCLHEYPVIAPMRPLIEKVLGFTPSQIPLEQKTEPGKP